MSKTGKILECTQGAHWTFHSAPLLLQRTITSMSMSVDWELSPQTCLLQILLDCCLPLLVSLPQEGWQLLQKSGGVRHRKRSKNSLRWFSVGYFPAFADLISVMWRRYVGLLQFSVLCIFLSGLASLSRMLSSCEWKVSLPQSLTVCTQVTVPISNSATRNGATGSIPLSSTSCWDRPHLPQLSFLAEIIKVSHWPSSHQEATVGPSNESHGHD